MKSHRVDIIFGGTFDPPHLGHDQMLKALADSPLVETIHVIPTFQNPLKHIPADREMLPLGDLAQRKRWITLWIEDFRKRFPNFGSKIKLDFFELDSEKATYTYDALQKLKKDFPDKSWVLSVGDDQLEGFSKWYQVKSLLKELDSVWVFSRVHTQDLTKLVNVLPSEIREIIKLRVMAESIDSVSSSEIRKQIRQPEDAMEQVKICPVLKKEIFQKS